MNADAGPLPDRAIRITDRDDPRIALFRSVRERDLVGREGVFIAEGASVLTVLLERSRLDILAVLVEETRAARMGVLRTARADPLYVAPQTVLDAIAGFPLHRGILAAGRVPPPADLETLTGAPVMRLPLLVGLSNHDNVGGIYRSAAAFGAAGVVVDGETADPFYRKAIRVGVGAPLVLPTARVAHVGAALERLREAGVTPYALSPSAPTPLRQAPLAPRAAFLFGTEGPGLPAVLLAAAEAVSIPIAGMDSLNVSVAAAIVLNAHAEAHGLRP